MSLFQKYEKIKKLKSSLVLNSRWQHKNAGIFFVIVDINEDGTYKGRVTNQNNSFLCFSTLGFSYEDFLYFFKHWSKIK
jgi:hypothetical protein